MGGFAIFNHNDLFGSAMTTNMISLALDFAGHNDDLMFYRFLAFLIYVAAMVLTVIIAHKISTIFLKNISIFIDATALIIIGLLPKNTNPFVSLFPIFFSTAFQWCSFRGADGFTSSSIFSTNNLRQCTTGFAEYICNKDKNALKRGIYFGKVLISFHIGVIYSYFCCKSLSLRGAWLGIIPVATAFILNYMYNNNSNGKEVCI